MCEKAQEKCPFCSGHQLQVRKPEETILWDCHSAEIDGKAWRQSARCKGRADMLPRNAELEAENAKLSEALEDTLTYLKVDIVGFTSRPERLKAPMDLYEEVKAALAAGEGEKAPPEPQSRSQERRFEVQGEGEGG